MAYGPQKYGIRPPLLCHMNRFYWGWGWSLICWVKIFGNYFRPDGSCGLPNANAESQRFSYAISQIAPLPPVIALMAALNRKLRLDTLRFGTHSPTSHWPLSCSASKSQRLKLQRLQNANATKSQTLAFYKSQRFGWADPGVLWKEAPRAMRAMRGKTLESVPFQPYFGHKKLPQTTVKLVLPSKESCESKKGCNRTQRTQPY